MQRAGDWCSGQARSTPSRRLGPSWADPRDRGLSAPTPPPPSCWKQLSQPAGAELSAPVPRRGDGPVDTSGCRLLLTCSRGFQIIFSVGSHFRSPETERWGAPPLFPEGPAQGGGGQGRARAEMLRTIPLGRASSPLGPVLCPQQDFLHSPLPPRTVGGSAHRAGLLAPKPTLACVQALTSAGLPGW